MKVKVETNAEERKFMKLSEEKGYTVTIKKQHKNDTLFEVSKDGKTHDFTLYFGSRIVSIKEKVECMDKIFQLI